MDRLTWGENHTCHGPDEGQGCCVDLVMPAGVYQHFKGQQYLLIGTARLDQEYLGFDPNVVVYVPLYTELREPGVGRGPSMQVRSLAAWVEQVEWPDGITRSRFEYMGDT